MNPQANGANRGRRLTRVEETSAGGFVLAQDGSLRVALIGRETRSGRIDWCVPKGHPEGEENHEQAAIREIAEETNLATDELNLIGVYDFQRMNQVIIAYHVLAHGPIQLSPELAEYRLFPPEAVRCWPAGTGYALAQWLRGRGIEPQFIDLPKTE